MLEIGGYAITGVDMVCDHLEIGWEDIGRLMMVKFSH